jgi:hypothetical protein
MLFAGTGRAFYYTLDDGGTWTQLRTGLPPAPVSWITVEPRFHDVVVSTYGRGLYILPNLTLLEQTGQIAPVPSETKVFAPAAVFRQARDAFAQIGRPHFTLWLPSAPSSPIRMEILDESGKVVRSQQLAAHQGMNGVNWDLRYDAPTLVALRTTPPENPHIWEEPRFQDTDVRRITHWGITSQTGVPLAAPGKYQARFTINGQQFTQPVEVLKDPAIVASVEDLKTSTAMQVRIRDDITRTSDLVNRMEIWRKQIEDQTKANAGKGPLLKALADLNTSILDVEHRLVSRSEMLSDDKYFPEAYKVYMNLIWLSGGVGQGASDEAGSVDYKPTDTQVQVLEAIEKELGDAKNAFERLASVDVPAFNKSTSGKLRPIADTLTPYSR